MACVIYGVVAQSGEHCTVNAEVARSKLVGPAIFNLGLSMTKITETNDSEIIFDLDDRNLLDIGKNSIESLLKEDWDSIEDDIWDSI